MNGKTTLFLFNFKPVFCCLIAFTTLTIQKQQSSGSLSTSLTCRNYDVEFPHGICRRFINDANVRINVFKDIGTTEEVLDLWFSFAIPYLKSTLFGKNGVGLKSKTGVKCAEENLPSKFQNRKINDFITYEDFVANTPLLKWYLCHLAYPICINNNSSDLSFPCQLDNNKALSFLQRNWRELSLVCKKTGLTSHEISLNTSTLVKPSVRFIERCQRPPKTFTSKVHAKNCYSKTGAVQYNGTVRRTFNGDYCIPWQSVPAFRYKPYAAYVQNNYCRNPQGYGLKPWCYINAESREWGYCEVSVCDGLNHAVIWMTLLCVVCVAVIVVLMYFFLNRQRQVDEFEKRFGKRSEREVPEGLSVSVEQMVTLT